MTITNEQARYLFELPKKIVVEDNALNKIIVNQVFPLCLRFELVSENDDEFTFLWEINQSSKDTLRISLHCQEDESKIGIFRVDYNSGHKNPEINNGKLPELFTPFIGKQFDNTESHVHYHVEGYRSLAWAIPIAESEQVNVKQILEDEKNMMMKNAILNFAEIVNIETEISLNMLLL